MRRRRTTNHPSLPGLEVANTSPDLLPRDAAVVPAYRCGSALRLERESESDAAIRILLPAGIRLKRNGRGRLMVYRYGCPFGVTLADALALGWCSVVG